MPDLLSLPRELRDDVYGWLLRSSTALESVHRPRIRFPGMSRRRRAQRGHPESASALETAAVVGGEDHEAVDGPPASARSGVGSTRVDSGADERYYGEGLIRYPGSPPLPPTSPLLLANHQLRAEMQETIQRSPVRYKLRLGVHTYWETLYPTWTSIPAITDRIDELDVEVRFRDKKTSSIFSTTSSMTGRGDEEHHWEGSKFLKGLRLLQRFLERGPSFFANKRESPTHKPITIGTLTLQLVPKDDHFHLYRSDPKGLFDDVVDMLEQFFFDSHDVDSDAEYAISDGEDLYVGLLRFVAARVDTFAFKVDEMRTEWNLAEVMAKRDEIHKKEAGESSVAA